MYIAQHRNPTYLITRVLLIMKVFGLKTKKMQQLTSLSEAVS